ncbi:MAG TPA: efflux transporter outer membrane subunit [Rhizomicrobium sp.]|nr:efflux transporter outer membrane subunit [Rhizomicrobium sp.]
MSLRHQLYCLAGALAAGVLLAACTAGPDFKIPASPKVSGFTAKFDPTESGPTPLFRLGQDIAADWWTIFHSPQLDALIKEAFEHNPDLQAAQASLRVAMENVKAQSGAFYPTVTAGAAASRNKQSAQLSPVLASPALLYSLYQTQLSVSWTPDLWGGNRRTAEALQAQADGQRYELQATYVSLASNLVAVAIKEASLREQIDVTHQLLSDEQRIAAIERQQKMLGQISGQDVAAQETLVAQTEALLPGLEKQLAQQRNLLSVLAGHYPADQVVQQFEMKDLAVPPELPLSLPARLVEQRADVRIAQENMHAASAEIGIAEANRLPNITLTADAGAISTQLGQLFGAGSGFWALGASVAQPVFDGGTLLHRQRAAEATFEQASSLYRSTVLRAFQDVADTLSAVENDVPAQQSAEAAEKAAARSLSLARQQVALGQTSRLALLTAEAAYLQTRMATTAARADRLADSAALLQALGGGWWNRSDKMAAR